jgi:hypothetical protein
VKNVNLEKVKIRRIIGPTPSGAAVLLGNEKKTFVVFVGFFEAAALIREINSESPARPLTHELLQNVFLGFDIEVKKVIISTIIENTFCATLVLQQKVVDAKDEWSGKRNEVRIDARPSDCLVLALKNNVDIYVTPEVFEQVQDISKVASDVESPEGLSLEDLEFELSAKSEPAEDADDLEAAIGAGSDDEESDEESDDNEGAEEDEDEDDEDEEDDEDDSEDENDAGRGGGSSSHRGKR